MEQRKKHALSDRERQLVKLASEGHTDASIAHVLGISEATVSTYWGRVRVKVGPYSRPELIARLLRQELGDAVTSLRKTNQALIKELQLSTGKQWGDAAGNYYLKLVREAPDAIIVIDEHGAIELTNEEFDQLFGYEPGELEQQNIYLLIPERFREAHVLHREQFLKEPAKRKMSDHSTAVALRKDGTEFPIAATLAPIDTAAGLRIMCVVREVSHALAP